MTLVAPQIILILTIILFLSTVFLHLVHKNTSAILLYVLQSSVIAFLLTFSLAEHFVWMSLIALLATIAAKIVLAPYFLSTFVNSHHLRFSSTTYLNNPLTLIIIALFVALSFSRIFAPLATLAPTNPTIVLITIASFLTSFFLLINRKGAISQILGILSIENSIVAFALFTHLEQSPALELGITFNIFIWISIATIFVSLLYRQFGSLDVSSMKQLSEHTP